MLLALLCSPAYRRDGHPLEHLTRETAEARNAEALAAAARADEEAERLAAAAAELESMRKECVGADSPLVAPGSVLCT